MPTPTLDSRYTFQLPVHSSLLHASHMMVAPAVHPSTPNASPLPPSPSVACPTASASVHALPHASAPSSPSATKRHHARFASPLVRPRSPPPRHALPSSMGAPAHRFKRMRFHDPVVVPAARHASGTDTCAPAVLVRSATAPTLVPCGMDGYSASVAAPPPSQPQPASQPQSQSQSPVQSQHWSKATELSSLGGIDSLLPGESTSMLLFGESQDGLLRSTTMPTLVRSHSAVL